MTGRRARILAGALVTGLGAGMALPATAAAHGLVGRADLPIPAWLFGWAAAIVLVISFVGLAVLWPRPRLEQPGGRRLFRMPAIVEPICGVIGVATFAVVVYSGLAGTQTATANLAPTTIYVILWVGFPVLSVLFGDVFRPFNPWLSVARAFAWLADRLMPGDTPPPLRYPAWLGRWPAAVGIVVFVWIELIYRNGDQPRTLAILAIAYFAVQLVGMSLFGIRCWSYGADPLGVYFNLYSRLAPLRRRGRDLWSRRFLAGVTSINPVPGTIALVIAVIATTTFDGASEGPLWLSIANDLNPTFVDAGLSSPLALELTSTIGLVLSIAVVSLVYWIGIAGMRTVEQAMSAPALARKFVHTLVPIAFAYVLAHYFSSLAYQGQAMFFLISDPLGDGSDLFGTADTQIDYSVVTATGIWYVQVAALVIGHVCALVLAHDRALAVFQRVREATRSQYFMLAVMIAFTSLGLWLLSAANE